MAIGKGGNQQNQNQSGYYSGATSRQTDATTNQTGTSTTSGTQTGTTTGTQTGTQSGQVTANPTAGYGSVSDLLQGIVSGNSGLTPQQLAAMGINTDAANNYGNSLDYGGQVLSQYVGDNHQAHTIADPRFIVSPTASTYQSLYTNPWESSVVDATRNDLTQGFKESLNELSAKYGGSMGNGREGVAAGQLAGDYTRALGSTLGGLRSEGFKTSLTPAMGDASQQFQANVQNVGNQQQTAMFNAGQENVNDNLSRAVIGDWVNMLGSKYGAQTGAGNTNAAISQGGIGNLVGFLGSQVPAFGQSSTGASAGSTSGSSTGTTDSTTQTTLENILKSISSGTSSGTTSGTGSSSGKSGGISLG